MDLRTTWHLPVGMSKEEQSSRKLRQRQRLRALYRAALVLLRPPHHHLVVLLLRTWRLPPLHQPLPLPALLQRPPRLLLPLPRLHRQNRPFYTPLRRRITRPPYLPSRRENHLQRHCHTISVTTPLVRNHNLTVNQKKERLQKQAGIRPLHSLRRHHRSPNNHLLNLRHCRPQTSQYQQRLLPRLRPHLSPPLIPQLTCTTQQCPLQPPRPCLRTLTTKLPALAAAATDMRSVR